MDDERLTVCLDPRSTSTSPFDTLSCSSVLATGDDLDDKVPNSQEDVDDGRDDCCQYLLSGKKKNHWVSKQKASHTGSIAKKKNLRRRWP